MKTSFIIVIVIGIGIVIGGGIFALFEFNLENITQMAQDHTPTEPEESQGRHLTLEFSETIGTSDAP